MKRIRAGRGIGDGLYLQAIVRQMVMDKVGVHVLTDFPELYSHLKVPTSKWTRESEVVCHYSYNISNQLTNIWQDCCKLSGVKAELKIDWNIRNSQLVHHINRLSRGKPVLFVNGARRPFNRADGYGKELMPKPESYSNVLKQLRERFFSVYVGKVKREHSVEVDLDLHGKTTITDILDIASASNAFFGQCSFLVPLAESFNKPFLGLWSSEGLASRERYVRSITPKKILTKPTSKYVIDDWSNDRIRSTVSKFCDI